MKQQIVRFSPHQNGKVMAVMMAVSSLVFLIPFALFAFATAPANVRPPLLMFLAMPVVYLVMGYVMVAIGCVVYNFLAGSIGGIEYESRELDA